jgi:hypothetical protein
LIKYWGALWGRLGQVTAIYGKVLTGVFDIPDLSWVGINTALDVLYDGIIFPTSFPEFVTNLKVLIGNGVALVMFRQTDPTKIPAGTF